MTQCGYFKVISQFSLTLSLGQLFAELCNCDAIKGDKVTTDNVKENCDITLKVLCAIYHF